MAIYTAPKVDMGNSQTEMALIWYQQNRKLSCGRLITSNTYAVVVYNYVCLQDFPICRRVELKTVSFKILPVDTPMPPRSSFLQTMIPSIPNLCSLAIIIAVPP